MILLIDNYDSFVYTLAGYVKKIGHNVQVIRNDKITLDSIAQINPNAIILSPGPCTPQKAGICLDLVKHFGQHTPILGVCLGHQVIGEIYGGTTTHAEKPQHGKSTEITHNRSALFKNIPSPFPAGHYHSLITTLPDNTSLQVTATASNGEIMAVEHPEHPVFGVQFHPESILTPHGIDVMENFLYLARSWNTQQTKHYEYV